MRETRRWRSSAGYSIYLMIGLIINVSDLRDKIQKNA